jgi:hypothetical protein
MKKPLTFVYNPPRIHFSGSENPKALCGASRLVTDDRESVTCPKCKRLMAPAKADRVAQDHNVANLRRDFPGLNFRKA